MDYAFTSQCVLVADYVGFMKKVMKQMQSDYPMMSKVELELTQEREMDSLPIRPSKLGKYYNFLVDIRLLIAALATQHSTASVLRPQGYF